MIYEFRTYDLKHLVLAEVEAQFAEALPHREKYSKLAAFWHTEVGPLNQIIHVWPYESMDERNRVRAEAAKDPHWPPKISDYIVKMRSEIFIPFDGAPTLRPGSFGPVYEMRSYTVNIGGIPGIQKSWQAALPGRLKLSDLAFVGYSDVGRLNQHMHIWAYKDFNHRFETRIKARTVGVWPPKVDPNASFHYSTQENKLMLPASFSPMQ